MSADSRSHLGATFDQAAAQYDRVRPGYPEALFDDIAAITGIQAGNRVLEIGSGTGLATLPLLGRGYHLSCLEPGRNLAHVLRGKLQNEPAAEVVEVSFEDWSLEPEAIALVVAATSFHWVDPAIRMRKVFAALRPEGSLALFRHVHVRHRNDDGFYERVQPAYRRYMPDEAGLPPLADELTLTFAVELNASGLFLPAEVRHYPWTITYSRDAYLQLLGTFSVHLALPADTRAALWEEISALIDQEFSGQVVRHHVTQLEIARKRVDAD